VGTDNNLIQIENPVLTWDPLNSWSFFGLGDNSLYDLTDVDIPDFWNNSPLDVLITAHEHRIRIDRSILMLDYESNSVIPEPATLIMLGMGLLGTGFVIRRKHNK
jgi:hypothetical protein